MEKNQGTPAVPFTLSEKRQAAKQQLANFTPAGRMLLAPDGFSQEAVADIFGHMCKYVSKAGGGQWDESGQGFPFPEGSDLIQLMGGAGVAMEPQQPQADPEQPAQDGEPLFSDKELGGMLDHLDTPQPFPHLQEPLRIPVDAIEPHPMNPRKRIREASIREMADSLNTVGQIHPITVIPVDVPGSPIKYRLVAGERRWLGSRLAGIPTIRADIRNLTDEQVADIQLAENMHREDVHPMDEATFLQTYMAQGGGRTVTDVAARINKTPRYVATRMRLNRLTAQWQNLFLRDAITMEQALTLSDGSPEVQQAYAEWNVVAGAIANLGDGQVLRLPELQNWVGNRIKPLASAPFDIGDPTLFPKMGACGSCPFNTAVASLFQEDGAAPSCTLPSCYAQKELNSYVRTIEDAVANGLRFLVPSWFQDSEKTWIDVAVGAGATDLLTEHRDFNEASGYPDHPGGTFEEWKKYEDTLPELGEVAEFTVGDPEDPESLQYYERPVTAEDLEHEHRLLTVEYEDALNQWGNEVAAWNAEHDNPLLGIFIAGTKRLQVIPIEITAAKAAKGTAGQDGPSAAAVDAPAAVRVQIKKMQDKADRSDELDGERLWLDIRALMCGAWAGDKRVDAAKTFNLAKDPAPANDELGAICWALSVKLVATWDAGDGKAIANYLKVPSQIKGDYTRGKYERAIFNAMKDNADLRLLYFLLRLYMIRDAYPGSGSHLGASLGYQAAGYAFAISHIPEKVVEAELLIENKKEQRRTNLAKRIEQTKRQAEKGQAAPAPEADTETADQ